ncbi:hypothetical protein HDU97_006838 [Phlyctochytrium planicorne]|nr:hypothetical protein HDU97_006838 [Phlyctochytrium planicorne]
MTALPKITFTNHGDEDVYFLYCAIFEDEDHTDDCETFTNYGNPANDPCVNILFCSVQSHDHQCTLCTNWLKCETAPLAGADGFTFGTLRIEPGQPKQFQLCSNHTMIACVKSSSTVNSATIDDFNILITGKEHDCIRLVVPSQHRMVPVVIQRQPMQQMQAQPSLSRMASSGSLTSFGGAFDGVVKEVGTEVLTNVLVQLFSNVSF